MIRLPESPAAAADGPDRGIDIGSYRVALVGTAKRNRLCTMIKKITCCMSVVCVGRWSFLIQVLMIIINMFVAGCQTMPPRQETDGIDSTEKKKRSLGTICPILISGCIQYMYVYVPIYSYIEVECKK